MRTTLKRLSALCAGTMLLACADLSDRFTLPEQPPVARSADESYVAGRNHCGRNQAKVNPAANESPQP